MSSVSTGFIGGYDMGDRFNTLHVGGDRPGFDAINATTIEYVHEKIHEGECWHAGLFYGTLVAGGTMKLSIMAGTITPHVLWTVAVGGDAEARITEGGTIATGTAVTVWNMCRNNSAAPLSTVARGGVLTGGTLIHNFYIPGGTKTAAQGNASRSDNEWIFKPSKTTTIEIINITTAYPASLGITFYEEAE